MIDIISEKLAEIITFSTADETEALVEISDASLTRFANNVIHQNTSRKDVTVLIRAAVGKKIGIVRANKMDTLSLRDSVNKAIAIAKKAPERKEFYGLPQDTAPQYKLNRYDNETAVYSPKEKAERVKEIVEIAQGNNASGAIENGIQIMGLANSKGIHKTETVTGGLFNLVLSSDGGSGFGSAVQSNIKDIDFKGLTRKAVDKAVMTKNPEDIEPGKYTVYLEPYAVGEMLALLSYAGMGALSVQEGRSFLSDNIGKKILNDKITIYDDASDPRAYGFGFDYEGVTRQKVTIIDKGYAKGPVYDSSTAAKEGKVSTGHALPASSGFGPLPLNLILSEGQTAPAEMIKNIDKGIYVTRYHYTNLEHPIKAIFTGMTRDGTFLIENGEIKRPLKNLRFTQGIIESLNNVVALGNDMTLVDTMTGAYLVPSLVIDDFNFTSVTEF
jgi:PmbA protein